MKSVEGFDSPLRPIKLKGEPMEYKGIELIEVTKLDKELKEYGNEED